MMGSKLSTEDASVSLKSFLFYHAVSLLCSVETILKILVYWMIDL